MTRQMPANRRTTIRSLSSQCSAAKKSAAAAVVEAQAKEEEERFNSMANLVVAPSHPSIPDIGESVA